MDVLTVDFDRVIHAPGDVVKRTVLATLSKAGFREDRVQGEVIEAHKGSALTFCVEPAVTVTRTTVHLGFNSACVR